MISCFFNFFVYKAKPFLVGFIVICLAVNKLKSLKRRALSAHLVKIICVLLGLLGLIAV